MEELFRSDFRVTAAALWVIPVYETIERAARIPMTTITTRSSTMVKPDILDCNLL